MVRRWRGPEKQRGSRGVAGLATVKARESNRGPPTQSPSRRATAPGWLARASVATALETISQRFPHFP